MRKIKFLSKALTVMAALLFFGQTCFAAQGETGAELIWKQKIGSDYKNAPSAVLVRGDYVYTFAGKRLIMLNRFTGEILAVSDKDTSHSATYGIVPPSFGDGMIFVPVGKGSVAAFDESTLELLWETEDPGGQCNCEVAYADGKIFFGTWVSETKNGSFYGYEADKSGCRLLWSITKAGGFYRAKALYEDGLVTFGSDDGAEEGEESFGAALYTVNAESGDIISRVEGIEGDIRSEIVKYKDSYVFSTKAGYIYKAETDGLKRVKAGESCGASPAVDGNMAYVGTKDNYIAAVDLDTMELKDRTAVPGYPNGGIASRNGRLFFTCNSLPGGVYVLENGSVREIFTPDESSAQYCISPVAFAEDGRIYYKNDSGNIFALKPYIMLDPETARGEELWLICPQGEKIITPVKPENDGDKIKIESFPAFVWRKNLQPVTGVIYL